MVGAGVLGLPYACSKAGLLMGLILVAIVGFAVRCSFNLLIWSTALSDQVGYEELGRYAGGDKLAMIIKVFIILDSMGPLSAYMRVVGDSMILFIGNNIENEDSILLNKTFVIFIAVMLISVPLCFVEKMEKLEFTSLASLMPLGYLMVMQVFTFAKAGLHDDIEMFRCDVFLALPVVVFAFSCQQCMPPIYRELREQGGGSKEINQVVNGGLLLSAFSYFWVGFLGYLQFGAESSGNVMDNFEENAWSDFLWVSMSLSILFSYPVIVYPCRISVDRMFFADKPYSYKRFVIQNICIVFIAFGIGVGIPDFATLLGLFGAVTATTIGYILPPVFYLLIGPDSYKTDKRKWMAITLMVCGGIAGFISLIMVIQDYISSFDE